MKIRPSAPHQFARNIIAASLVAAMAPAFADASYQTLPFSQNWSNTGLITTNANWSSVPGIIGYRGDGLTGATGTDPQTILADGNATPVDVNANQTNPNTFTTGGIAEFHLADPTIALNGSGTADAPFIQIHLNTIGFENIQVAYNLRDLDGSADNAVQQVALQYRVGNSGNFINVPAAYVADSTTTSSATQVTPVSVVLPAAASNQAQLELRIMTTNAVGNDEWVGIDDIMISGNGTGGNEVNQPIMTTCPVGSLAQGEAASILLSATDADSRVNAASLAADTPAGFTLGALTSAAVDGGVATVALDAAATLAAGNYAVVVNFANDEAQTASCTVNINISGITPIHAIQGSGTTSPLAGQQVTTQGIVTKVTNNGFFMQDENPDADETTSEGIYVFTSTAPTVTVGNRVRVAASVKEFNVGALSNSATAANPLTELISPAVNVLAAGIAIVPTVITFPEVNEGDLERYEGMLVRIEGPLTVGQNYFLGRFGQLTVSAGGRLEKPTNRYPAGSLEAIAMADDNARRRILLDDGTSLQNPNPTPFMGADNTVRAGDTIAGITGVIDYGLATSDNTGFGDYRIHPTVAPEFTRSNPRNAAPAAVGGNIKVASFNVLNYFTTFTNGQTADGQSGQGCTLGSSTSTSNCRGANNAAEFTRQQTKIVNAIKALNADVVGLMEIQNNGAVAVQNLVTALNTAYGSPVYSAVTNINGSIGDDAIRVALIYKNAAVTPVGQAISDTDPIHNRPPLLQTFSAANGEKFSVVVNHFKSKGSCPASGSDADQGDGQGCWNDLRTQQAQALRNTVQNLQASSGDNDVIVIGDLNAYGKEDPILDFTAAGYVDQVARFDNFGYSYVFDGEAGYLDHALATPSLSAQVAGAKHWRINADEPAIIDYNTEFKQPACATCGPDYYSNTVYRSSDHDPVLIGLNLLKQIGGTAGRDTIIGTPGDDVITGGIGADTLTGGAGADQFVFTSLRDGVDTITDFQPGVDRIVLTQVLQSLGIPSTAPIANGYVTCSPSGTNAVIGIDPDATGSAVSRPLVLLKNQTCAVAVPGNFIF
jgi:predicted extracellular nuclease